MTYNRGKLKKEIIKGEWLVKCNGIYTDDYAYDNSVNYQMSGYMKALYFPSFWKWLEEKGLSEQHSKECSEGTREEIDQNRRKYSKMYEEEKTPYDNQGMIFDESDFKGYGSASLQENGEVWLMFGYKSYTFIKANK